MMLIRSPAALVANIVIAPALLVLMTGQERVAVRLRLFERLPRLGKKRPSWHVR